MKASEVIARLTELIEEHDDLDVEFVDYEYGPQVVEQIEHHAPTWDPGGKFRVY